MLSIFASYLLCIRKTKVTIYSENLRFPIAFFNQIKSIINFKHLILCWKQQIEFKLQQFVKDFIIDAGNFCIKH